MKDKLNRLAKGIMEEAAPAVRIAPDRFFCSVPGGRKAGFSIEVECITGKNLKGAAFCDEFRITLATETFLGRMSNVVFELDTAGLSAGDRLKGTVDLVTNAGEFSIPYDITIARETTYKETAESKERAFAEPAKGSSPSAVFSEKRNVFSADLAADEERTFLMREIPEDDELLFDACSLLIKENADGRFAFPFYKEAVKRDLRLNALFESLMAAFPEENNEPMPMEMLIYYSYEKRPDTRTADRLYANIIRYQETDSEIYRTYEPAMRDHAAAAVFAGRMNTDLAVIYDRMLYPDMIDRKSAAILPDILKTCRIRVIDPAVKNVHVRYPGLKTVTASGVKGNRVYLPVYFSDAVIEFADDRGNVLRSGTPEEFGAEKLLDRPDLLARCFELDSSHKMLLFSAVREVINKGARTERDRNVLIGALGSLDLTEEMRRGIMKELLLTGGDPSWLDSFSASEIDAEAGMLAFRGFLGAGRFEDAYLYLRRSGAEKAKAEDVFRLVTALFEKKMMPVLESGTPDRFFLCLCKKLFDLRCVSPLILDFLAEEYNGSGQKMFEIAKVLHENGLPERDLTERTLVTQLFTEEKKNMDETFSMYVSGKRYKETVLRAYFTLRMTDFFEKEDSTVAETAFEALSGYLGNMRNPEGQPLIYSLALTARYAEKEKLDPREEILCQRLSDMLIAADLIFPYTRKLSKKIHVPDKVTEKFYVEYRGTPARMEVRILPDEPDWRSASMKKNWKNIYVAGEVLFLGEEMEYRIYDAASGETPAKAGRISAKRLREQTNDRYGRLNGMEKAFLDGNVENLRDSMVCYSVESEVNRELFQPEL